MSYKDQIGKSTIIFSKTANQKLLFYLWDIQRINILQRHDYLCYIG